MKMFQIYSGNGDRWLHTVKADDYAAAAIQYAEDFHDGDDELRNDFCRTVIVVEALDFNTDTGLNTAVNRVRLYNAGWEVEDA